MNPTIEKFGFPDTLIKEYEHWVVLVRPSQVTLGSLILAAKSDATAYGSLPREVFAEQADVVAEIERALAAFMHFDRINYLMLMMVDPNVHFHVIPRHAQPRPWNEIVLEDAGWPGPPRLDSATKLDSGQISMLATEIRANFR